MIVNGKSSTVEIFKDKGFVLKKFKPDVSKGYRESGYHSWLRETECLKRLQGNNHFPQILKMSQDDLTIKMTYCGENYDGKPRPELIPQVWEISEALENADIKIYTEHMPFLGMMLHDKTLKMIDFEYALPEGSNYLAIWNKDHIDYVRKYYNMQYFEDKMKIWLTTGDQIKSNKYQDKLQEANRMIKNEWNNYQKSNEGNSAKWRIDNLDLRQYADKSKTLLDLGANHGEFGVELAKDFMQVSAVEPVVEAPSNMPENMTWFKKTLKEFCAEHNDTYDVVFSFAMTIQVRDNDGLNEDEIAQRHYDLVKEKGMMIYETQKLEGRPLNQAHVDKMLTAFRSKFGNETSSGNARTSGKRKYYIFKK